MTPICTVPTDAIRLAGTCTVALVELTMAKFAAWVPFNVTIDSESNPMPVSVTLTPLVPASTKFGEIEVNVNSPRIRWFTVLD